jgi:uncharacterized membrane protein YeaQ/YmgE (transglycosylase-associated protein family)
MANMGWLAWIIFGALAGWIASMIAGTNRKQGCLTDIVVGILGAFIGGWLMNTLTGEPNVIGFNLPSLLVAVLGAVILLVIIKLLRR